MAVTRQVKTREGRKARGGRGKSQKKERVTKNFNSKGTHKEEHNHKSLLASKGNQNNEGTLKTKEYDEKLYFTRD